MQASHDDATTGNGHVTMSATDLADLTQKVDALAAQVAFLAEEARLARRQRQEWAELRADLTPVAFDAYRLTVEHLEEVEQYVQFEDILHLAKRLLRNTRNLEQMLDQMESLGELWQTMSPISGDGFLALMTRLDEMERKGYFTFLRGGMEIVDRVVTSFTEDDVRLLGENIVLILGTIKEMTQPELMLLMRRTVKAAQVDEPGDVSLLGLVRQLNDPDVRRGLSKTLLLLKSVSETAPVSPN